MQKSRSLGPAFSGAISEQEDFGIASQGDEKGIAYGWMCLILVHCIGHGTYFAQESLLNLRQCCRYGPALLRSTLSRHRILGFLENRWQVKYNQNGASVLTKQMNAN